MPVFPAQFSRRLLIRITILGIFNSGLALASIETPKKPTEATYFGATVTDEYSWLENAGDPSVQKWTIDQNEVTEQFLKRIPFREKIAAQLTDWNSQTSSSFWAMQFAGDRYFAMKSQPPLDQPLLVTLTTLNDAKSERVILDLNKYDTSGVTAIDWFVPSLDGKRHKGDWWPKRETLQTNEAVLTMIRLPAPACTGRQIVERSSYEPGALGENLTLDAFDETLISIGDVFQIGEVIAQATFPRIPCGKVNYRMEHPNGQKSMQKSGRSGVYFRILQTGRISLTNEVRRTSQSDHPFLISEAYKLTVELGKNWPADKVQLALRNGAFPKTMLAQWLGQKTSRQT